MAALTRGARLCDKARKRSRKCKDWRRRCKSYFYEDNMNMNI